MWTIKLNYLDIVNNITKQKIQSILSEQNKTTNDIGFIQRIIMMDINRCYYIVTLRDDYTFKINDKGILILN